MPHLPTISPGRGECVLLVEDEEPVALATELQLTELGYRVVTHLSVKSALEAFRDNPHQFDLVLTDQTMPHVTGLDLARQLSRIRPGVPIVLYTGFGGGIPHGQAFQAGVRKVLAKPVEPAELLAALEAAIEQKIQAEGLEK